MNKNKIAVDVVLIPPEDIVRLAVGINENFHENTKENYVLDPKTCIPHLTLLMGLVEEERLPEAKQKLSALAGEFSALNLRITGVNIKTRVDGRVLSNFAVEKTAELQKLHENILDEMSSVFNYEGVTKEMFFSPPLLNEIPLSWVKGFAKTSVREKYKPHITLGFGRPEQLIASIPFRASRLALCHLGNYCSCRDILWSAELKLIQGH